MMCAIWVLGTLKYCSYLFSMYLKYMSPQHVIYTRQAFMSNGTSRNEQRINRKFCERGMGGMDLGEVCAIGFSSFMDLANSIFGRKELRHIYLQLNKLTNQSNYSAIQLGSALHLVNKHFWFYLFGFWHIININSVDSTFIKTSLIYICTVSKWFLFLFFSSL